MPSAEHLAYILIAQCADGVVTPEVQQKVLDVFLMQGAGAAAPAAV